MLDIQLTHSTPGQAAGRGKIERFFRTVRSQFLVEVDARGVADLDELNRLFTAWVERIYHRRVHRETGETPLARFMAAGIPDVPTPALLREAFLWAEQRTVTKTALVSLAGNRYEVDATLAGRKVECVFDPFDLTHVEIRHQGRSFGMAAAHELGAHVHPRVAGRSDRDDHQAQTPPPSTGIDYLALVEAEHRDAARQAINFADLPHTQDPDTGRDDEPDRHTHSDGGQPPPHGSWHEPPLPLSDPDDGEHAHRGGDDGDGDAPAGVTR